MIRGSFREFVEAVLGLICLALGLFFVASGFAFGGLAVAWQSLRPFDPFWLLVGLGAFAFTVAMFRAGIKLLFGRKKAAGPASDA